MTFHVKLLIDKLLNALYTREPHVKAVISVTGGGTSATDLLFREGSSSTILEFVVPYARTSLQKFLKMSNHFAGIETTNFC